MDSIFSIKLTEVVLAIHGYEQHPHYGYWFYKLGDTKEVFRLERKIDNEGWIAFLPCYFYPVLRELSTLGELNNLHVGFYDIPIIP